MHITFVKKLTESGDACAKCGQVEQHLRENGYWHFIDSVLVADEPIGSNAGTRLATRYGIDTAPFFVVTDEHAQTRVYTIYLKFVEEILEPLEHEQPADELACA